MPEAMSSRVRWVLLAVLLVVFTATVVMAGRSGEPPPPTGTERLGPEPGEPVPDYLRRAQRSLPAAQAGPVWALVQLDDYLAPAPAAALLISGPIDGVRLSGVVLRVPLPGVQTALIFRDLPGQRPAAELANAVRSAAQDRARAGADAPAGDRQAAVASAEAARLRGGCVCVLSLLVRARPVELRELAARPGIRAVHAAAPGTPQQELAVSPLLPEQRDLVGPVPDSAPIPPEPHG